MPELPEVEIVRQSLSKNIKSKKINKVLVRNRNLRFKLKPYFEIKLKDQFISNILISLTIILIASFFTNYDWNSYSENILNSSKCLLSECENESGFLISSTDWIGKLITADFIIAFQLTGLILLASLIGALALLRIRMGSDDS